MLKRAIRLNENRSYLILGPRRVGKSTYLGITVKA
jgi:predicted AAA+ superfamily ATPase